MKGNIEYSRVCLTSLQMVCNFITPKHINPIIKIHPDESGHSLVKDHIVIYVLHRILMSESWKRTQPFHSKIS